MPLTDTMYAPGAPTVTAASYEVPLSATAGTVTALPCGGVTTMAGGSPSGTGLPTNTVEWPSLGSGVACTNIGRATSR